MEMYLNLDKNQRTAGELRKHLLTCKKCQAEVKLLSKAERLSSEPLQIPVPLEDKTIENILSKIQEQKDTKPIKHRNYFGRWIASGLLLLVVLICSGYIASKVENSFYSFCAFMIMAIGLLTYISMFFANNLDFFIKRIGVKGTKSA